MLEYPCLTDNHCAVALQSWSFYLLKFLFSCGMGGIDGGEMSQKEVLAETQAEVLAQTTKAMM